MSKLTMKIVEIGGSIHWRYCHGDNVEDIKQKIKDMRKCLTQLENQITENDKREDK